MYTVLWTVKNGNDHWERCEDRQSVAELLMRHGIQDDPDVMIFPPEADDCVMTTEDIFAGI